MIERAALAMADRKRPKQPAAPPAPETPPAGPEPPEPFIVNTSDMISPRVTLTPPPASPQTRLSAAPPVPADRMSETKLIAEFDRLLGAVSAKSAASSDTRSEQATTPNQERSAANDVAAALRPLFDDQFRLPLTRLQSAGATLGILALVIGAAVFAARTWIVAYDWSCRAGVTTRLCPPPVAMPKPPALPELPT